MAVDSTNWQPFRCMLPDSNQVAHARIGVAGGTEQAGAGAPDAPSAEDLSGRGSVSRAVPAVRAGDAAPGDRVLLAPSPGARRPAGAGTRGPERYAGGLDLAARGRG